jgi:hypothetical protein
MTRSWPWLVALLPALTLLGGACKETKKFPTAPAPKTITAPPPPEPMAAMAPVADDGEEDPPPAPRGPGPSGSLTPPGTPLPPMTGPAEAVRTINGHPEGPKAEVFNAVVNNAYGGAARCLASAAGTNASVSLQVKMVVVPSGVVETAEVVAGAEDAALRGCLVGVVKALTFPPFKGPNVTQTLPFTLVRQADAPTPR